MDQLRLQVIFAGIDKLTAPIRRLQAGSRGLSKDIDGTTKKLGELKRAQALIGNYRGAETRLQSTSEQLEKAKAKTAALRAEMAGVAAPTTKMASALARAERAEDGATKAHEKQGSVLGELRTKLTSAGVGVDNLADHEARLASKVAATSSQLSRQQEHSERLAKHRANGEKLKSVGGGVGRAGAVATVGITLPVVAMLKSSIGAAKESAAATAHVDQAIKSMGVGAKFSTGRLSEMAGQLQQTSLFDDDDIMSKVTANLLTFGNIGPKVFGRAQQSIVDLTALLGGDLLDRSTMVAKALDAPARGVMALSKIGAINKDWAMANKDRLEKLVKTGKIDVAQGEILAALEKQYKGQGKAMRDASPDGQLQQNWRTLQETIGAFAINALPPLLKNLNALFDRFNALTPGQQQMILGAIALAAVLGPMLGIVGSLISVFGGLMAVLSIGALPLIAIIAFIGMFAYLAYQVYQNWGNIASFFSGLWASVVASVTAAIPRFLMAMGPIGQAALAIYNNWGGIKAFFVNLWNGVVASVQGAVAYFQGLGPRFRSIGAMMLQGLLSSLSPTALVAHIMKLGSMAVAALKGVLGIHSPSRVFAAIGGHMMGGLSVGLDRTAPEPIRRVHAAGLGMKRAMATSALAFAPIAASAAPTMTSAPRAAAAMGPVHIHIHAQPGDDAEAIARAVRVELERIERDRARGQRSSYRDTD